MSFHGVSLSTGTCDPIDRDYLRALDDRVQQIDPFSVSDHLYWTGVRGRKSHDLLLLPYTEEAVSWTSERIDAVQSFLKRPILLENISSYQEIPEQEMSEPQAGCGLLLDVNNVFVNSVNHDGPRTYPGLHLTAQGESL